MSSFTTQYGHEIPFWPGYFDRNKAYVAYAKDNELTKAEDVKEGDRLSFLAPAKDWAGFSSLMFFMARTDCCGLTARASISAEPRGSALDSSQVTFRAFRPWIAAQVDLATTATPVGIWMTSTTPATLRASASSKPLTLAPLAAYEIFVPRNDTAGGSGAGFIIVWQATEPANPPVVEALHLNMPAGRSIAFITSARPIATR